MPRTKEENERIKSERKQAILDVSLPIFAEKGLSATKISDIAKAAGISYGLVYSYFPSKEAVFTELINQYLNSGKDIIEEINSEDLPALNKIIKVFQSLLKINEDDIKNGLYFRLLLQLSYNPQFWEDLIITDFFSDPVFTFLSDTVKSGQDKGEIFNGNPLAISFILGFIALGINMNSEVVRDSEMNSDDITSLLERMLTP